MTSLSRPVSEFAGANSGSDLTASCTVIRPESAKAVPGIIADARQDGSPLCVFSSSPGSRRRGVSSPVVGHVLDLSQLRHVHDVDADEAVAIIDPGLTFRELDAALAPMGLRSYKPLLPRSGKSVIASYLEREPLTVARDHWDVLDPFGAVEIIFGTGESFRTGGASNPGSQASHWKAGMRYLTAMGPSATDFLRVVQGAQGTLGVVSWATVMCDRIPLAKHAFLIGADDPQALGRVAAELSYRRIGHEIFLSNRAQLARFAQCCGAQVEPERLPAWALFVTLSAACDMAAERLAWEVDDARSIAASEGLALSDDLGVLSASAIAASLDDPHLAARQSCFREGYREIFFLSQIDRVPRFLGAVDEIGRELAFPTEDIGVYIQPRLQGRNCHVEILIPAHSAGSAEFARRLALRCHALGGLFSRPYGDWAGFAFADNAPLAGVLNRTKHLLDPDGILAPGRLPFLLTA